MNGTYGTVKPANINIEKDAQILYNYKPNRGYENNKNFQELSTSNLMKVYMENDTNLSIDGLYNLKLPLSIFGRKGIYTIYIKPKELTKSIYTTGVLVDYPDVRGVIFQTSDFDESLTTPNGLVGYRIDYGGDGNGYSRIITSSNLCDVIPTNGQSKYRIYNNYGSAGAAYGKLIFCTVTPSSSNSFTPNVQPSIGVAGETVKIVNTKFNPVMFEIEMVEHDAETLSYMLEGEQVRNLENGTFTIYNHDKEIYKQLETYTVKTRLGKPLYDIKADKNVIDSSQSYDNTIASV
jgi:hypothetical protein